MKLVFYGGGHASENRALDDLLCNRLITNKNPLITYIPSCSYYAQSDFIDFVEQYQRYGFRRIISFPIDGHVDSIMMKVIFKSDMIHLSGGNTFSFLQNLRRKKLLPLLKNYVKNGGVLTGLSAGAIMMTPTIDTAAFPSFDRDDNDVGIKNLNSLNLVKFMFFPHYRNSKRTDAEILKMSKQIKYPIIAAPDGSGLVVENKNITAVNKVFYFSQGIKTSFI